MKGRDFNPISEGSVAYLAYRIEEDYLGDYPDNRGSVEIYDIEAGNLPSHSHFYVHFSCEGWLPDNPKGQQCPSFTGTWIGDFKHYSHSNVIEDMEGEVIWMHRFPGSGTFVYKSFDN